MLGSDPFSLIGEPAANYLPVDVSLIVTRPLDADSGIARAEGRATRSTAAGSRSVIRSTRSTASTVR